MGAGVDISSLLHQLKELEQQPEQIIKRLKESCFAEQRAFVDDPSRTKVALCSRRASKTFALAVMLVICCLLTPGAKTAFLTTTRKEADRIFTRDAMAKLVAHLDGLPVRFAKSESIWKFDNGSEIMVLGGDVTEKEKHKLRGGGRRLICIDEIQSFTTNVDDLMNGAIVPSLVGTDLDGTPFRGQLVIAGTPGEVPDTYFHKITDGRIPGWSIHKWRVDKNPHQASIAAELIAEALALNPNYKSTPSYRREWLGEWVLEKSHLVYHYDPVADADKLPDGPLSYVLGVDLGFNDASAFVLVAWSAYDPALYVVEQFSQTQMLTDDVVDKIKDYRSRFNIQTVVVDSGGGAKITVATWNIKHHLNLTPATDKANKAPHIKLFNSDLQKGKVKLLPAVRTAFVDEWSKLVWDPKKREKNQLVEHVKSQNHLSDALLYAWFHSRNYLVQTKAPDRDPWVSQWEGILEHYKRGVRSDDPFKGHHPLDTGFDNDWGEEIE